MNLYQSLEHGQILISLQEKLILPTLKICQ